MANRKRIGKCPEELKGEVSHRTASEARKHAPNLAQPLATTSAVGLAHLEGRVQSFGRPTNACTHVCTGTSLHLHMEEKETHFGSNLKISKYSPGQVARLVRTSSQYVNVAGSISDQGTYKNECINKWNNKSMFLSLSLSINKRNFLNLKIHLYVYKHIYIHINMFINIFIYLPTLTIGQ